MVEAPLRPLNVPWSRSHLRIDCTFQGVVVYVVDIWVLQKRNVVYTPERVWWDLTQMIDDVLFREMFDPSSDLKYEVLTDWSERDEPEDNLLRSEILVAVYYEKARLP